MPFADEQVTIAVFERPEAVSLKQVAMPALREGEALVEVLGCTLCGSDLHTYTGRRNVAVPTVLGHEIAGRVVALGQSAGPDSVLSVDGSPLAIGDRVVWAVVASCGSCDRCRRGLPQKCRSGIKYGHAPLVTGREPLGGFASHCLLLAGTSVVRLPDTLPLEVVCPAGCATATVVAALEPIGDLSGRRVGVFGLGMLGLTACCMARERGATTVIGLDPDPDRAARGREFGATSVGTPSEFPEWCRDEVAEGLDLVLEMSGVPASVAAALTTVAIGGSVHLVGSVFPSGCVSIDPEHVVRQQITLRGVHNYAPRHLVEAIRFLSCCHTRYPFAGLIRQWLPLSEIKAAFELATHSQTIRVGVRP